MNVLVLQSFLAVSITLQICIYAFLAVPDGINCIYGLTVFVTPTACVNSLPIFELYAILYDDEHCLSPLLDCTEGRYSTVC